MRTFDRRFVLDNLYRGGETEIVSGFVTRARCRTRAWRRVDGSAAAIDENREKTRSPRDPIRTLRDPRAESLLAIVVTLLLSCPPSTVHSRPFDDGDGGFLGS